MNPTYLVFTIVGLLVFGYALIVPTIGVIVIAYVINKTIVQPAPAFARR